MEVPMVRNVQLDQVGSLFKLPKTRLVTFGKHKVCTNCRRRDRMGRLYAVGWTYTRDLMPGDKVLDMLPGGWRRIVCRVCKGQKIVEG